MGGSTPMTGDRYHHGDLPNVLRATAAEVIAERGLADFSLREVARRAGVSHTAPAHHFGDAKGLLTALAIEGFEALTEVTTTAAASTEEAVERLVAVGRAYVALGRTHPGHCQVVFRPDIVHEDPDLAEAGAAAFGVLHGVVAEVCAATGSSAPVDDVALLCWSMVQGIVALRPTLDRLADQHGVAVTPDDELVGSLTRLVVEGVRAR